MQACVASERRLPPVLESLANLPDNFLAQNYAEVAWAAAGPPEFVKF